MKAIVIERLGKVHNLPSQSHGCPELPVSAQAKTFVRTAIRIVIRFRDPDVLATRQAHALIPLLDGFPEFTSLSAILIRRSPDTGRESIGFRQWNNRPAGSIRNLETFVAGRSRSTSAENERGRISL